MSLPLSLLAAESTVVLSVPKMNCPVCPIIVKKSLQQLDGVSDVQVSLDDKKVVVIYDDAHTSIADLQNATSNVGYPSSITK